MCTFPPEHDRRRNGTIKKTQRHQPICVWSAVATSHSGGIKKKKHFGEMLFLCVLSHFVETFIRPAPTSPLPLPFCSFDFPPFYPLNSVQTPALNLDSLCLSKHMECYCGGMLQVWEVVCAHVCARAFQPSRGEPLRS